MGPHELDLLPAVTRPWEKGRPTGPVSLRRQNYTGGMADSDGLVGRSWVPVELSRILDFVELQSRAWHGLEARNWALSGPERLPIMADK